MADGGWQSLGVIADPDGVRLSCDDEPAITSDVIATFHDDMCGSITFRMSRSEALAMRALINGGKYRRNYEKAQRRSRNNTRRKR